MTPAPRVMPRRTVLAVSGTAVLAAAAACSAAAPAPAASTTPTAASTNKASSAAAAAPAAPTTGAAAPTAASPTGANPTGANPTGATPTGATSAAPTGTPLAAVADVQSAGSLIVNGAAGPVLLASSGGSVVGHTAVCTHQQCTIAASGSCPCHGSKFNITTGAVENGPARQPLAEVAVTVSGGQVYAG